MSASPPAAAGASYRSPARSRSPAPAAGAGAGAGVGGGGSKRRFPDDGSSRKKARSSWSCPACTMDNDHTALACTACTSRRPPAPPAEGSWACKVCTMRNEAENDRCVACTSDRVVTPPTAAAASPVDLTSPESHAMVPRATGPKLKLEENKVFLAAIEESFGQVGVSPQLLSRIAQLVRGPWSMLLASTLAAAGALPVTTLQALQKALVSNACKRAMHLARVIETILKTMEFERQEMHEAQCLICEVSGASGPGARGARAATQLIYSEHCFKAGQWAGRSKHFVCLPCASKHVMQLVAQRKCDRVTCPHRACDKEVDMTFIKRCLSRADFDAYSDTCFTLSTEDPHRYQKCPNVKCSALSEIVGLTTVLKMPKGGITITDDAGKVLSEDAWRHYSEFRLRCHDCSTNYCTSCRVTPYHLGKTCSEFKAYQGSQHCRFCTETLDAATIDSSMMNGLLVCISDPCQKLKSRACTHTLGCGHPCYGVLDEVEHPLCLDPSCDSTEAKYHGEDLCSVCYVEELQVAPVVQLTSCGHAYHEHCVVEKLNKGRPSARITFGYLDCPACKVRMDHPSAPIQAILRPAIKLHDEVAVKAVARLKIEGMLKDEKLIAPTSRYFGKPQQYAMESFAFYTCHRCAKFYFGGKRDCEQNAAAEVRSPAEFICFDCADVVVSCKFPKHKEYQLWKCGYCCSPAVWFCGGSMHFCDPCHSGMPAPKPCKGAARCPLQGKHGPNNGKGENIGCGICTQKVDRAREEHAKEVRADAAAVAGGSANKRR